MIKNISKKKVLIKKSHRCYWLFAKFFGLMFTTRKVGGMVFRFSEDVNHWLHMFFVFYPIDILFLNKKFRVVEIKKNFKPFTVYFPKNSYRYVVEMPAGCAKGVERGDLISI